ncbi:MAG: hypothetical protein IPH68_16745 [Chitinophagaceae bacterium]|nr:hypothetical protein [Chitinophagaceae bacterium]
MLSEEQVKKLISANESLQVQLDDLNTILASREQEIAILIAELMIQLPCAVNSTGSRPKLKV